LEYVDKDWSKSCSFWF